MVLDGILVHFRGIWTLVIISGDSVQVDARGTVGGVGVIIRVIIFGGILI